MPIVYILTNECMPDTVKIGIADNLEQRIRQLDNTSVALPFEFFDRFVEDFSGQGQLFRGVPSWAIRFSSIGQGFDVLLFCIKQGSEYFLIASTVVFYAGAQPPK
uniref:T5orf172 domain-containing protein n=1 Tax=Candidatus Kentrum sp. TC TaxID=2126339 RepID=A0A450YZ44_9GAMM|nr:MAG: T5orf172 domain-containing protein [Candidatus Kentron sp. TC]